MNALTNLLHFDNQTQALSQVAGRLSWDQETMMPYGSADQRGSTKSKRLNPVLPPSWYR